jgi:hypothetical protein
MCPWPKPIPWLGWNSIWNLSKTFIIYFSLPGVPNGRDLHFCRLYCWLHYSRQTQSSTSYVFERKQIVFEPWSAVVSGKASWGQLVNINIQLSIMTQESHGVLSLKARSHQAQPLNANRDITTILINDPDSHRRQSGKICWFWSILPMLGRDNWEMRFPHACIQILEGHCRF